MKNFRFIRYSLPAVLLIGLLACEERLEVEPTQQSEDLFFSDQNRVQRGVGGVYAGMEYFYGANFDGQSVPVAALWNVPGDDLTNVQQAGTFDGHQGITPGNNKVAQWWDRHYVNIGRSNFMLEKLEDPAIVSLFTTDGLLDHNKGELYFLRGWNYYRIRDWFGKGPIITERLDNLTEVNVPMAPPEAVMEQVISDLDRAEQLLPEAWSGRDIGRVTKNSARGLLVKAYVMRAAYQKNDNDYALAIQAFNRITGAALMPHFADNFDYTQENNQESLFEYQASLAPVQDHPWVPNDVASDNAQMGFFVGLYIQNHWGGGMIACYPGPTGKLIAAFDPEDPRLANTVSVTGQFPDGIGGGFDGGFSWFGAPQFIKYLNGERGAALAHNAWSMHTANNPRIIRYADVKLAVAEAYLQTGDEAAARQQVNDIRKRARFSTDDGSEAPQPADYTTPITMNQIIHERYLELAGEDGIRWSDLKRWHAAGFLDLSDWKYATYTEDAEENRQYTYSSDYQNGEQGFGFAWSEADFGFDVVKNLKLPIPQSEIVNNTAISESDQNPGF